MACRAKAKVSFCLDVASITGNFHFTLFELVLRGWMSPVTITLILPCPTATFKPVEY